MAKEFSAVVEDRDQALALINEFIATGKDAVLLPFIRGMMTPDDEEVFAIMQGSGNEVSTFGQFLHLVGERGLIGSDEEDAFTLAAIAARRTRHAA